MEGGQGGTNSQEFPRIKERRKNVMWRRCAERRGLAGAMEGQWVLREGTITQEDRVSVKGTHLKIWPRKKKMQSNN